MGSHRGDAIGALKPPLVAQVVPDIATFAVDDGFAYRVPDGIPAALGSIVRVPLGGRRVRGFVTSLRHEDRPRLKDIIAVSGNLPVFGPGLLETLRWAALHYVAPAVSLLAKPAPPNVARAPAGWVAAPSPPLRSRVTPFYMVGPGPWGQIAGELTGPVLGEGGSALVVMATVVEVEAMAADLERRFPGRVLAVASAFDARALTAAWVEAVTTAGRVIVGTREAAFWPIAGLGHAVIVNEGRRGMKDRQTPTTHVREILRHRAAVERFGLSFLGSVPTAEALAGGVRISRTEGRSWPVVEIADRSESPPGSGLVSPRARAALRSVVRSGGRAFVFTHRRGFAPAFRCVGCRTLRDCPACGAAADRGSTCRRCNSALGVCRQCGRDHFEPLGAAVGRLVEELTTVLGKDVVGEPDSGRQVVVGTERDLVGSGQVDLAVVIDADAVILAPSYRAEEDALRLFARVAQTAGRGRGRRCLVQTSRPGHRVLAALRRGDAIDFLEAEVERRERDGFPPVGELLAVETAGEPAGATESLRRLAGDAARVLGPATVGDRHRWLIQGRDLRTVRIGLRGLVQEWRDGRAKVRIDADPIDL